MRRVIGSLAAVAVTCLFTAGFGVVAHAQLSGPCPGDDCGFSRSPVPGVRIIRAKDYPKRPSHYESGDRDTTLADFRESLNRFALVDLAVPPDGGPAAHTHSQEWEIFFVLGGTANFFVGVDPNPPFAAIEQPLGPGTAVYSPVCRVMGFTNRSGEPVHALTFALPAGIDQIFELSGDDVVHFNDPIPPPTQEQFLRTAFWAERENVVPYIAGVTPPPDCQGVPDYVISSITRDRTELGPFGETRVVLVTPDETGNLTGATAFCGAGPPNRPGGSVKYTYFAPDPSDFPPPYVSPNGEIFYILDGTMRFLFGDKTVQVAKGTYIEIQPGVPFSFANFNDGGQPQALGISVISPPCSPPQ